jgi:hypothetical protein
MSFTHSKAARVVTRRAVRKELDRPEYPAKFKHYIMDHWAHDCYALQDSRANLADVIRECRNDPDDACWLAAHHDWTYFSATEFEFMIEIVERVLDDDTAYIKRLHDAMILARKPEQKQPLRACEVAANLYMELVQTDQRPTTPKGFGLLLKKRLKSAGLKVTSVRSIMQAIGVYDAWRPPTNPEAVNV